jgi:hypothetical protein
MVENVKSQREREILRERETKALDVRSYIYSLIDIHHGPMKKKKKKKKN